MVIGEYLAYSSLQDSEVKFSAWLMSWRSPMFIQVT